MRELSAVSDQLSARLQQKVHPDIIPCRANPPGIAWLIAES
jgi:hypothetical protein